MSFAGVRWATRANEVLKANRERVNHLTDLLLAGQSKRMETKRRVS